MDRILIISLSGNCYWPKVYVERDGIKTERGIRTQSSFNRLQNFIDNLEVVPQLDLENSRVEYYIPKAAEL